MRTVRRIAYTAAVALAVMAPAVAAGDFLLLLGPEGHVQANGSNIVVPGYSVPSFDHWDGDGLPDLIVGEGSGTFPLARVRVYLNAGTESSPSFSDFFYVQSAGSDLTGAGAG